MQEHNITEDHAVHPDPSIAPTAWLITLLLAAIWLGALWLSDHHVKRSMAEAMPSDSTPPQTCPLTRDPALQSHYMLLSLCTMAQQTRMAPRPRT